MSAAPADLRKVFTAIVGTKGPQIRGWHRLLRYLEILSNSPYPLEVEQVLYRMVSESRDLALHLDTPTVAEGLEKLGASGVVTSEGSQYSLAPNVAEWWEHLKLFGRGLSALPRAERPELYLEAVNSAYAEIKRRLENQELKGFWELTDAWATLMEPWNVFGEVTGDHPALATIVADFIEPYEAELAQDPPSLEFPDVNLKSPLAEPDALLNGIGVLASVHDYARTGLDRASTEKVLRLLQVLMGRFAQSYWHNGAPGHRDAGSLGHRTLTYSLALIVGLSLPEDLSDQWTLTESEIKHIVEILLEWQSETSDGGWGHYVTRCRSGLFDINAQATRPWTTALAVLALSNALPVVRPREPELADRMTESLTNGLHTLVILGLEGLDQPDLNVEVLPPSLPESEARGTNDVYYPGLALGLAAVSEAMNNLPPDQLESELAAELNELTLMGLSRLLERRTETIWISERGYPSAATFTWAASRALLLRLRDWIASAETIHRRLRF